MPNHFPSLYTLKTNHYDFYVSQFYNQTFSLYEMDFHNHPEFEIMYISKGTCCIRYILDGTALEHHLGPGEWIFLDANVPHLLAIDASTPCKVLNIEIGLSSSPVSTSGFSSILDTSSVFNQFLELEKPVYFFDNSYDSTLIYHIMHNLHTYLTDYKHHSLLTHLEISKLLLHLAEYATTKTKYTPETYYVKKVKSYIDTHFENALTIEDLANHVGLSAAYMQRLFTKQIGLSIVGYITQKRIDKAIILLTQTKTPITDIAIEVGFNSRQHFTHTFKTVIGVSPHQFRTSPYQKEIPLTL